VQDALTDGQRRTRRATEAHLQNAAIRALDDPARLAQAARIIRVALERNRISLADLAPAPDGQQAAS
jgi:hypothetical protein